jgi:hypothetical protein
VDGAYALVDRGMHLAGIDYLSIGDPEAHRRLLARGVGVIEGRTSGHCDGELDPDLGLDSGRNMVITEEILA